jgi:hypothetical protein
MKTLLALIAVGSLALLGCDQGSAPAGGAKPTPSGASDKAKEAPKAIEAPKDAAHNTDATAKTADALKALDAAHGTLDAVKAEGTKWLTDTVSKQWPAAKEAVVGFEKAVAGVKDAGVKGKVEAAIKELKDQIPPMEGLVAQLQNFKDGDYNALLAKAKEMFAGFMRKVDEVKAMIPH